MHMHMHMYSYVCMYVYTCNYIPPHDSTVDNGSRNTGDHNLKQRIQSNKWMSQTDAEIYVYVRMHVCLLSVCVCMYV